MELNGDMSPFVHVQRRAFSIIRCVASMDCSGLLYLYPQWFVVRNVFNLDYDSSGKKFQQLKNDQLCCLCRVKKRKKYKSDRLDTYCWIILVCVVSASPMDVVGIKNDEKWQLYPQSTDTIVTFVFFNFRLLFPGIQQWSCEENLKWLYLLLAASSFPEGFFLMAAVALYNNMLIPSSLMMPSVKI